MQPVSDAIDKAIFSLPYRNIFRKDNREFAVLLLLREKDWRPVHIYWWKGKEACIIGADPNGNFYLRVCDGTVRFWDHTLQVDEIIALSVREFVSGLSS